MGGGASQFTLVAGLPLSDVSMVDVGLYAQDEWKIKPNLTFSYGLRYETQTGIPYEGNWAPRVSLAYGLGHSKQPEDRAARRLRHLLRPLLLQLPAAGRALQRRHAAAILVSNPDFYPPIPTPAKLSAAGHQLAHQLTVANNLHVPYTSEAAFSVEQQVTKNATISVTYLNSRGVHQLH